MWLTLTIIIISVAVLFLLIKSMRAAMRSKLKQLLAEESDIEEKLLYAQRRNKELKKEIKTLEQQITMAEHDMRPVDLPPIETDKPPTRKEEAERLSQYMLSHGMLTVEQAEKALKKMSSLRMDYLGVCLTLGFIDLNKAKAIVKTQSIYHSPLSAEKD
ncbi:hypothetical protein [Salidesulfovibrio onnuriiensis]|uniref:hypothetical protein n=1 Tax=Salidesulfovibrio onnuriiensis TaxID=2583823 RepID=UPI0011C92AFC|nr:hypothetical protein [Salidesulfovibrio onnuriiensis]